MTAIDHLQQVEPQASASLEMAEVTPCLPIGRSVMTKDASALNRGEQEASELGARQKELSVVRI